MSASSWHIAINSKPSAAHTLEDLQSKILSGELAHDQKVWSKGMEGWQKSAQVEALQPTWEKRWEQKIWYVAKDGKPSGPMSAKDIEEGIKTGEYSDQNKFWRKGMDQAWPKLGTINELAPIRERAQEALKAIANEMPPIPVEQEEIPPIIEADPIIASVVSSKASTSQSSAAQSLVSKLTAAAPDKSEPTQSAVAQKPQDVALQTPQQLRAQLQGIKGVEHFAALEDVVSRLMKKSGQDCKEDLEKVSGVVDLMRNGYVKNNAYLLNAGFDNLRMLVSQYAGAANEQDGQQILATFQKAHESAQERLQKVPNENPGMHGRITAMLGIRRNQDATPGPSLG